MCFCSLFYMIINSCVKTIIKNFLTTYYAGPGWYSTKGIQSAVLKILKVVIFSSVLILVCYTIDPWIMLGLRAPTTLVVENPHINWPSIPNCKLKINICSCLCLVLGLPFIYLRMWLYFWPCKSFSSCKKPLVLCRVLSPSPIPTHLLSDYFIICTSYCFARECPIPSTG